MVCEQRKVKTKLVLGGVDVSLVSYNHFINEGFDRCLNELESDTLIEPKSAIIRKLLSSRSKHYSLAYTDSQCSTSMVCN